MQQILPPLSGGPAASASPLGARADRGPAQLAAALLGTKAHLAPAIARVALGVVILPHGAQKLLGWFGGYGFAGTMKYFTESLHLPWVLGFAAILAETLGGVALLAGFASRLAAAALAAVFATAALVHWPHGFFANWFGNQKGEGIEYFLLGLALAAIVVVHGGGAASVDHALAGRLSRRPPTPAANNPRPA